MAKHAKRKKTKSKSRRRVSGIALNPTSEIVQYGSIVAGFLLAGNINPQIDKIIDPTKVDQKLVAGGQAGIGAAYMFLKKGKKNLPMQIASGLLIGSGVKRGMSAFGMGAMPINSYQKVLSVSGYQDVNHVGAYNPAGANMGYNAQRIPINGMGRAGMLRSRMRA